MAVNGRSDGANTELSRETTERRHQMSALPESQARSIAVCFSHHVLSLQASGVNEPTNVAATRAKPSWNT